MKTIFAIALLSVPTAALADRPATPNWEQSQVIGPHAVRVSWRDSTQSHSFHSGGPNLIFEVEAQNKFDPSSGYLHFDVFDADGIHVHWDVGGLVPGLKHCFRVWSRDPDSDMRSDQPSAWTCVTLPQSSPPSSSPAPALGAIMPMMGQTIWFHHDASGVQAKATDGFILAGTPGHLCPAPWRDVAYQNGGFPGLGGAHIRSAADPYWLCWSSLLPANARVKPKR